MSLHFSIVKRNLGKTEMDTDIYLHYAIKLFDPSITVWPHILLHIEKKSESFYDVSEKLKV